MEQLTFGFTITGLGSTGIVFGAADVYFSDRGDKRASVPDNSSTLGLLLISTATMFGASRFGTAFRS